MTKIDANLVSLITELNAFQGIETFGSCGGHTSPARGQWEKGTFYIKFRVARNDDGYYALEFLAWLINHDYSRAEKVGSVILFPEAAPPWMNTPGKSLCYILEGHRDADPRDLAHTIARLREHYVSPAEHKEW